jgi:indole-3-glycerol phosphate synthase
MSGVADRVGLVEIARGRADAVLIGTERVRASDPGARLRALLETFE